MFRKVDVLPGLSSAPDPARTRRAGEISELVRTRLRLDDDAAVTVQQLACSEPGCPPLETVIAVLAGAGSRRWTVHRPLVELDDALVESLLTDTPEGDHL